MSAQPLWTTGKLTDAARGTLRGTSGAEAVTGISIDTRSIAPGEAFFAIRGDRLDGHEYANAALERGASVAVVEEAFAAKQPSNARLIVVNDTLEALRNAGVAARARSGAKIVAVTGSVGKTSTKEALRIALGASGEVHASAASFNNHWGVPLSLSRLPEAVKFGVFEIGMNHAGEIEPLVKMVRPHVAIVTTVEPVHLEHFSGIEAIADAKAEIFLGLEPGGAVLLYRDNPQYARLAESAKRAKAGHVLSFGEHESADVRLLDVALKEDASAAHALVLGDEVMFKLGAPGKHLVMNALAVLAAVKLMSADLAKAALALGDYTPPQGRGRRVPLQLPGGSGLLIDESYNANPASMRAAIEVLSRAPLGNGGRRIAVLGDMLELGEEGPALHAGLAAPLANGGIDLVFCSGPLMRSLWDALSPGQRGGYAESAAELEPDVISALRGGDAIMVKGSNGSRMGPLAASIAQKFGMPAKVSA